MFDRDKLLRADYIDGTTALRPIPWDALYISVFSDGSGVVIPWGVQVLNGKHHAYIGAGGINYSAYVVPDVISVACSLKADVLLW